MSDEFGPDFITVTDEEGNDLELEFLDALEHNGIQYMAFFPADADADAQEDQEQEGEIVILKAITEDGEEFLSTPDTDEELDEVYQLFMEQIFSDEDDEDEEEE